MNGRGEAPGLAGHRRPGGGAMDGFPTPRAPEPYLVAINLTRRCNLRCRHCYLDAGSRREGQDQELTTAELIALFEEIAGRARETLVVLSGGEPLLREDIHVLISTGNTAGLRMVLGTNGLLMDTEVAARLKQAGLEGVGISLDSLSPLEHDGFRGVPGAWRRAVTAIEACRAVELHVQLHTTLTRQNVAQIPSFVGLAQYLDVAMVNFFFLICTGRGQSLSDLTPQEYESALQAIARVQAKMAFPMIQARCAPHFKRILYQMDPASPFTRAQGYDGGGCLAATRYCRVDPTGNVTPCPYLKSVAGNLRRASFWTIWDQSPLLAELRRPTRGGRCGRCEFAALCG
ncbi:MAG: radical SAM protein, partial [Acidobacteriota bacterium]